MSITIWKSGSLIKTGILPSCSCVSAKEWRKTRSMGHPVRLELDKNGPLIQLVIDTPCEVPKPTTT